MPYYCTVPRCTSMAGKAKNVSFHQFPRDEELAKLWNRILKRGKPYTKYSKVCSLHFKPEDYTITSVGKNKGQWRTLRKDAVPTQNLPSESPVPYTRRAPGCWVPGQPSVVDPLLQQQMAQAIYMQTMLAMQAAGVSDPLASSDQQTPETTQPSPSGSSLNEIELLLRRDSDHTPKEVTYKCLECSKCFKDPDVYVLHKRTHKNATTNNLEKENYSANIQDREETLRANPILANLLKTSMRLEPESNISNILTVENQIMTALATNMEAYIRTLTSMLSNQHKTESEDKSRDGSEYEDENEEKTENANDLSEDDNAANFNGEDSNKDMCVDANERDTPMDEDDIIPKGHQVSCEKLSEFNTSDENNEFTSEIITVHIENDTNAGACEAQSDILNQNQINENEAGNSIYKDEPYENINESLIDINVKYTSDDKINQNTSNLAENKDVIVTDDSHKINDVTRSEAIKYVCIDENNEGSDDKGNDDISIETNDANSRLNENHNNDDEATEDKNGISSPLYTST